MSKGKFLITRGFTLIELLIVVAIIAILAAIAVPNFLEAQVRSKISRVNADIRALTVGVESYRVDHNNYPFASRNVGENVTVNQHLGPNRMAYNRRTFIRYDPSLRDVFALTSPVSYMTTIPTDPFANGPGAAYGYYTGRDDIVAAGNESSKFAWVMWSFGPDRDEHKLGQFQSTSGPMLPNNIVIFALHNNRPDLLEIANDGDGEALTYDPTNGSISPGDVWRFIGR